MFRIIGIVVVSALLFASHAAAIPPGSDRSPDGLLEVNLQPPTKSAVGWAELRSTTGTLLKLELTTGVLQLAPVMLWKGNSDAVALRLTYGPNEDRVFAFVRGGPESRDSQEFPHPNRSSGATQFMEG